MANPLLGLGRTLERSAMLPHALGERFLRELADPQLIEHRQNIALLETLILEEMEGIGKERPFELWQQALDGIREYQAEVNKDAKERILQVVIGLLEIGENQQARICKIVEYMEEQRRHRDSEIKREIAAQTALTAREAVGLLESIAALFAVANELPTPRERHARFVSGLRGLVPDQPGRQT